MLEKQILNLAFKRIKKGGLVVEYWDGQKRKYGPSRSLITLKFRDKSAVARMRKNVTLGFGESYMDGLIEVKGDLANIGRIASENQTAVRRISKNRKLATRRRADQRAQKSYVSSHYDLGNDFYKLWLDRSMTYSCAYFRRPGDSLEKAQQQKIEHILKKLQLAPGMTLLDIGCGWGGLILTAARLYKVKATGITLSHNQYAVVRKKIKQAGLENLVKVELKDYRELARAGVKFDRIVSVGMFEHVGRSNHRRYFAAVHDMLKDGGISVLHTISNLRENQSDPWIDKYIFPGGLIPSWREVIALLPDYDLRLLDYESLRIHYALTLDEWSRRFERHSRQVGKMYDERFVRMWRLYLRGSSAGFRYGDLDLSQLVFTKGLNNRLPLTREHLYR